MMSAAEDLSVLEIPIYLYSRARVAHFFLQYFIMNSLASKLPGLASPQIDLDPKTLGYIDHALLEALKEDARNIQQGIYPLSVLAPESPLKHLLRIPKIIS